MLDRSISEWERRRILPLEDRRGEAPSCQDIHLLEAPIPTPEPTRPPAAAPNVLLVLLDDMGFGAPSSFGGPIRMPTGDRLAAGGLRFSRFHTTALCAPTRASLLTGRNHHAVAMGGVPETATSSPGYTAIRPNTAATISQVLRHNGYATSAFGKMHQTPLAEVTPVGPFERWPTGEGFERFYGFVGGETNHYHPLLYSGTSPVAPPKTPEAGYHLSEDLANKAIEWIREQHAFSPDRRFFCYLSFGATHAPLHVPRTWADAYRGEFDHGWNRQREMTLERQKALGVIPPNAQLTAWPDGLAEWEDLTDDDRQAAALLMELYAGFAEHTDAQVGRVVDALREESLLDDTLVIYIFGDNGASSEGGTTGTTNEWIAVNGLTDSTERILEMADALGGPETYPHYPAGWALAMDTPYQWVKQVASHYGGTRNPLVVHWPNGIGDKGAIRHQWHHVIDIVPTILEAAGLPAPDMVDGVMQQKMDGVSMAYAFGDPDAPGRRTTQYFEMFGNRAIYHHGWVACAAHRVPWTPAAPAHGRFDDDRWELYDTTCDWTQATDLASTYPDKLRELQAVFDAEARRNGVFPLDDRVAERFLPEAAGRRDVIAGRTSITYPGGMPPVPVDAAVCVRNRSHAVTARMSLREAGATGVVVAQGGRFGGWALYVHEGRLTYCHNVVSLHHEYVRSNLQLKPGIHELRMEFDYDGGGYGRGGDVRLLVDGDEIGRGRVARTTPFTFPVGEQFAVGSNGGSPVTPEYDPGPSSALPGDIAWVRIDTGNDAVETTANEHLRMALARH